MTEKDKKYMSLKYLMILDELLKIADKYEITYPDHKVNYGKAVLVFTNFVKEKPTDEEHRKLRRIQVQKSVDAMIDVLTTIEEGEMSDSDKEEFDEICSQVLEGEALKNKHIQKGKLVLCDGYVNQIADIDYDDFRVKLINFENDIWFWEKPSLCKKAH